MVESFFRVTQILEKLRIFKYFTNLGSFLYKLLPCINWFKNSTMTNLGISSGQFWKDNWILLVGIVLETPKSPWNNRKARCLTNESHLLFKPRTFLKNRTSNDLSVETIGYSKRNWGKWDEVHLVSNKGVKVSELSLFSTTESQFWTFPEIYINQKYHRLIETCCYG